MEGALHRRGNVECTWEVLVRRREVLARGINRLSSIFGRAEGLEDELETRHLDRLGDEIVHARFVAALDVGFVRIRGEGNDRAFVAGLSDELGGF